MLPLAPTPSAESPGDVREPLLGTELQERGGDSELCLGNSASLSHANSASPGSSLLLPVATVAKDEDATSPMAVGGSLAPSTPLEPDVSLRGAAATNTPPLAVSGKSAPSSSSVSHSKTSQEVQIPLPISLDVNAATQLGSNTMVYPESPLNAGQRADYSASVSNPASDSPTSPEVKVASPSALEASAARRLESRTKVAPESPSSRGHRADCSASGSTHTSYSPMSPEVQVASPSPLNATRRGSRIKVAPESPPSPGQRPDDSASAFSPTSPDVQLPFLPGTLEINAEAQLERKITVAHREAPGPSPGPGQRADMEVLGRKPVPEATPELATANSPSNDAADGGPVDEDEDEEVVQLDLRERMKLILDKPSSGPEAACFQYVVILSIACSVTCAIWETDLSVRGHVVFAILEHVFNVFFSVEIALRFWTSDSCEGFFCSIDNLVDMVATFPSALTSMYSLLAPHFGGQDSEEALSESFVELRMARMIRVVRLLRVLRLAKAMRRSESITIVLSSVWDSVDGLVVLVTFLVLGLLVAATFVWVFEVGQTDTEFVSIPAACWWAASTIMAVGYGDMIPETTPGKIVAVATMFLGVVIIAICIAVVTNSFSDVYQRNLSLAKARRATRERTAMGRRARAQMAEEMQEHVANVERTGEELLLRLAHLSEKTRSSFQGNGSDACSHNLAFLRESELLWRAQAKQLAEDMLRVQRGYYCGSKS